MKSLSVHLLTVVVLMLTAGNAISDDPIEEWVARYDSPGNDMDMAYDIAVDVSGNVYVTGYSYGNGTSKDYVTIKYNADGGTQWVVRYNGPGNGSDRARSIALDGDGNVYVTGETLVSGIYYDYATIKYNDYGDTQWVAYYDGPGNNMDQAYSIAVDGNGNVYVTGISEGNGTNSDFATIKYNNLGDMLWVSRYTSPGNEVDAARSIALDGDGNVYVTGSSWGNGTDWDFTTIKYNSDGEEQWVTRYNYPENDDDKAPSIALDLYGNIYVTGYSYGDYATIKYNNYGDTQWVARYNGPANGLDWPHSISLDGVGNVYVTGRSDGIGTCWDYATIKYNNAGEEQWVARYDGPGNSIDEAHSIVLDGDENIYVTGISVGSGTYADYATIKYNSDGEEQWVARYNGPGNSDDKAYSITLGGDGNVYVTGCSPGRGTNYDYATIKYSQSVWISPAEEAEFRVHQLYPITPNPSYDSFSISYYISNISEVLVEIYNLSGRLVAGIANGEQSPGLHQVQMEAMPPGVYFCRLRAGSVSLTKSFVIIQ